MRRKKDSLVDLEVAILGAALDLLRANEGEFHGYAMAKALRDPERARQLTAHGTLYRALERLEKLGLLASRWEDPATAAAEQRPLRRLYHITATGEQAWSVAAQARPAATPSGRSAREMAPS